MKKKHWQVSVFEKTSEPVKNDTFYTTDTEAYLVFELIDEDFTPDSAMVTVYNIYGKAIINVSVEVADGIVRYEMPEKAIGHPGGWRTQVIFTKDNEDYTTRIIEFDVGGHLLGNKKPPIVEIENWNTFIVHAKELIDDWEQLEEIRQANEQQRELAESARQTEFEKNETSRQTNELVREEAEGNRQSTFETNETERQSEFETKEDERESTFEINESTRQANELIREEAEGNRQSTFEEKEAGRQSEFEENEQGRESAESARVANEEERISKDSERDGKIEEIENSIVGKRIGGYTFNGNTEVHVTNLDEETGVFTATNHGLVNGMACAVALNLDTPLINKTSLPNPLQTGWRYIVNASQGTFQVSNSKNGEPVLFTPNPNLDTNLWHLEGTNSVVTSINLKGFSETELTIRFRVKSHVQASNIFRLHLNDIEIANNFYSEFEGFLTRIGYPSTLDYGHSNLAMFGEYKASLSEHTMIGKVNFYRVGLATRTNPHSELSYKAFKDTIWATNTKKIDAFRGVELNLGGHMMLNGSTLEVYNG